MSFLEKIDEYVKLPNFLQFVGVLGMVATVYFGAHSGYRLLGFVSLGVFLAGKLYNKIYR